MREDELMIGDWVHVTPVSHRVDPHDSRVGAIRVERDGMVYIEGNYKECPRQEPGYFGWSVTPRYLSPIRITSDFLQRNGFHRDGCYHRLDLGDGSHSLEFYMHEWRLRQFWQGVDEWNNHAKTWDTTFECQCYYVHELQHAFKLMNLNKEVVL